MGTGVRIFWETTFPGWTMLVRSSLSFIAWTVKLLSGLSNIFMISSNGMEFHQTNIVYLWWAPETEPGFKFRGLKHEPKNFHATWFIKKKIMVDKKLYFITKYLSQEGYDKNQKSWKLQYDILTFFEEEENFRSPNFG